MSKGFVKTPTKKMKNTTHLIGSVFLTLCAIGLIGRIAWVSFFATENGVLYRDIAARQQKSQILIEAPRGTIYDRNMEILAVSATVSNVYIDPKKMLEEAKSKSVSIDDLRESVASGLSEILGVSKDEILEKSKKTGFEYQIIKKKLEDDVANKVTEFISANKFTSVHLEDDSKRYYPNGSLASTILGFRTEGAEGYGLEQRYNSELEGIAGRRVSAKNAVGGNIADKYEQYYEPEPGNSLVLTIDQTIQSYLEKAVDSAVATYKAANRGLGIVMDVNTGEILAMATKPDFDPNDPFVISDPNMIETAKAYLTTLQQPIEATDANIREYYWKNKAITELYEPGSVFKVVTGSAAVEEKTIRTEGAHWNCPGFVEVEDRKIKCWKTTGHGSLDFTGALVNSCNPAFVGIGQSLGIDRFFNYFKAYGFTERTGIDLPGEVKPLFYKKNEINTVTLASESFGQSMSITPIQMISAYCAVVNGGHLVTPHVVSQIKDHDGNTVKKVNTDTKRQVISSETSEVMRNALEAAVNANGGTNAYVKGFRIGGKSGTSQKLNDPTDKKRISSFVGFAPADNPQIAVMVVVDEPTTGEVYGSVIAAPAVASVMADALPYVGVEPKYTEEELLKLEVNVPNILGKDINNAKNQLSNLSLNGRVVGNGAVVVRQVPDAGTVLPKNSSVILYTDGSEEEFVNVPNVVGMSPAAASAALRNAGLNIKLMGGASSHSQASATAQSTAAGSRVPRGAVIEVSFITRDDLG
jgi:Cell division protein FtsI/penicillin-binding protein 2